MSKRAILRLDGKLEEGFRVTLEVGEEGNLHFAEEEGYLDAAPQLIAGLDQWQKSYRDLSGGTRIKVNTIVVQKPSSHSQDACQTEGRRLQQIFKAWLATESFRVIDTQLREAIRLTDWVRVVIRTPDRRLHLLPWHTWDFIDRYPAEVAFSLPPRQVETHPARQLSDRVRILAILGHRAGIDVETDRALLQALPNAEVEFLVEPDRQTLSQQLWERNWDILFFAGHSQTHDEQGVIHINPDDSLNIEDLKFGLRRAIARGLQLAIFNSCDGLGLVYEVEPLGLPQMVVMRQPVPDPVAQAFLKHLLTSFVGGQGFYLAVREAREQLQSLEDRYPCASWLPIIFQTLTQPPLGWQDLYQTPNSISDSHSDLPRKTLNLRKNLLLSLGVAALVCGARAIGTFQSMELKAFDHFMQMRPHELEDPHLLIIGADEKDLRTYGHPLPDSILVQLLGKLNKLNPTAIGLDIIRDQPVPKQNSKDYLALAKIFKTQTNLITICSFREGADNSIAPPPKSPKDQIGFVNSYSDNEQTNHHDPITRRYLLSRSKNPGAAYSPCEADFSLGLLLLDRYFSTKKIPIATEGLNWKLGSVLTRRLESWSGGYHNLDNAGNQILINYRHTADPQRIAQQVTLRDVLTNSDRFDPNWVNGRIVLIGVVAPSVQDRHYTPYGEMRGLYLQAHAISQLRSAVEDNRVLLKWLSPWEAIGWVLIWTSTGVILLRWFPTLLYRIGAIAGLMFLAYGISWSSFVWIGLWTPLIPAIAALGTSWIGTALYEAWRLRRNSTHK